MKRTVWVFGLISGAILSIMMVATMPFIDAIGHDRGAIIGYTTMVVAFLLIYFGVRSYRDNVGAGRIGFGRALAVGTLIMCVASVCYVTTWEVLYHTVMTDFTAKYEAATIERINAGTASLEAKAQQIAKAKHFSEIYKNPVVNVALTFLEPLPVGLVFVLVSAGVLSAQAARRRSRTLASHGATSM